MLSERNKLLFKPSITFHKIKCVLLSVLLYSDTVIISMQCVTLSGCGHYAVLGMNSGHVEIFNVQSGIHRGVLGRPKGESPFIPSYQQKLIYIYLFLAHAKCVRGVAIDALTMEVYSGSADSTVKVHPLLRYPVQICNN